MFVFDPKTKKTAATSGGYSKDGLPIRDTMVLLGRDQRGILYEPLVRNEKSAVGVIIIHSDGDYANLNMCGELAKRGFTVFGGGVSNADDILDKKLLSVKNAIEFLRSLSGIEKVVLMGHSGGATLMTCYQAVAENGPTIFQGDEMVIKCSVKEPLPTADGIMTIDSNFGNGAMTLISIDPAVLDETKGTKLNPEYDIFRPEVGFVPGKARYTEEFKKKYHAAQRERNNRIIAMAQERLRLIEAGEGNFLDEEPFVVPGGSQGAGNNKLIFEDTSLLAHTKQPHPLLHADGSETFEIVPSVRPARGDHIDTPFLNHGAAVTTVRHYLTERAVLAGEDYAITEDDIRGILWDRSYDCPPANAKHIHAPLLCMGLTGGYEYLAAEMIYNNTPSQDKSIAFVEGASHMFAPVDPKWGDTEKVLYDYMAKWLSQPGRFIQ